MSFSLLDVAIEELVHGLVRQLHAQEGCRVRRHGTRQGRANTGEEGLEAAGGMDALDRAADRGAALGRLQTRLDGVDRENGDPHSNTGGTTSSHNSRQRKRARETGLRVLGRQFPLHNLVCSEVGGGAGAVAGEGHGRATEDGANAALLVQLADDVNTARVLGLLAGSELLLALDLEEHLHALERGSDERHGDGGEETGGRNLCDGELVVVDGGEGLDELLANVIAPERNGNWAVVSLYSDM